MKVSKTLFVGLAIIAGMVLLVASISIYVSRQADQLTAVELPLEQNLREVEVSIWEAIHAAHAFRSTADPQYSELYAQRVKNVDQYFTNYLAIIDTVAEAEFSNEFSLYWHQAKAVGNDLIDTVHREQAAEDAFFSLVDQADDIIDFNIQAHLSASDPNILAKEQSLREVEVSVWEAIHAGLQYTGLNPNITRAGHAEGTFAELMQRQFSNVEEFWSKYQSLATSDNEMGAISDFADLWRRAMEQGNKVVYLHDLASMQFDALYEHVNVADDVIDFKMQKYLRKRILDRSETTSQARILAIATSLLTVVVAGAICLLFAFSNTAMHKLAFNDALTGLPNRSSILRSLQTSIDRGDDNHFALLFLDVDGFKLINDSLGHEVGDELLKEIAHRLRETVRATDEISVPARLGGDEFVVLLNDLSSRVDAAEVAERILQSLSQGYNLSGHATHATASIGVVTSEHCYESACEVLRDADLAMYESKAHGKARYTVFDQTMREKVQAQLHIENEMRDGIPRDEFFLVYQPILSLETGQMEAAEALLRWMHPKHGMIGADRFIPVAEETGMIVPIGNEIINEACRQLAIWQNSPRDAAKQLCIHVNVSRKQLLGSSLVRVVEQALTEHAVLPECLHLEVTETSIMEDPKTAIAMLNELRRLGVKIDIDDFGTGHSSLSCIHEFPIDVLKIDRSFIASIEETPELEALLQAVVTLADNLDLPVVAEGIENIEQLSLLQELGCKYGQGFLFAKPMPPAELEQFIGSTFGMMTKGLGVTSTTAAVSTPPDQTNKIQQREFKFT